MSANMDAGGADAAAQATIARQAAEIEQLRRQLGDERVAEQLREALTLAATTSAVASPVKHGQLLELIVQTSAHVIGANAASLFLTDFATEELVFEVALGQKADEVRKFRVSLGHGIAGLVALSGQPMAIADADSDPRQASDIAQSVGYVPRSILCVPLFIEDQVIGVLELLDKIGAPVFSPADMEVLTYFANIAAIAIEQSRTQTNLPRLINDVLTSAGGTAQHLQEVVQAFATDVEEGASFAQSLQLAQLVQDIASYGEYEAEACRQILQAFATYLRSRPQVDLEAGAVL